MRTVRIGTGAGFSDDRVDPAVALASHGHLDYLVFECLAERTMALSHLRRLNGSTPAYDPWLEERFRAVLEPCRRHGTRIVTNMGAADPIGAARRVTEIARELGLGGIRVAAVTGDDVTTAIRAGELTLAAGEGATDARPIAANAYLGAEALLPALARGADVIITGRVADPSLFLAPLIHELRWDCSDWPALGAGTAAGHLLECGAQVTGGYFADPGPKDVAALDDVGFPIAEVHDDGSFVVTKLPGSGGEVSVRTVTEQLFYEVHDPARYVTPDVVADFSGAVLTPQGADRVRVSGITGSARPDSLKVSVAYRDGFLAEGQISYAGAHALPRAMLARDVVRARLQRYGPPNTRSRFELIGVDAVHRGATPAPGAAPREVRLRVAARTPTLADAHRLGREVTSLWLNGPAGGGGAVRSARENLTLADALIPREQVRAAIHLWEA